MNLSGRASKRASKQASDRKLVEQLLARIDIPCERALLVFCNPFIFVTKRKAFCDRKTELRMLRRAEPISVRYVLLEQDTLLYSYLFQQTEIEVERTASERLFKFDGVFSRFMYAKIDDAIFGAFAPKIASSIYY